MNCKCKLSDCPKHSAGNCENKATTTTGVINMTYIEPALVCEPCAGELFNRINGPLAFVSGLQQRTIADLETLDAAGLLTPGFRLSQVAPGPTPVVRFVAVGCSVMDGSECVLSAKSKTFAKRAANALNRHKVNSEGV